MPDSVLLYSCSPPDAGALFGASAGCAAGFGGPPLLLPPDRRRLCARACEARNPALQWTVLRSCRADDHSGFLAFADVTGASPGLLFWHFGHARAPRAAPRLLSASVALVSHRRARLLTASRPAALRASFPCFVASGWLRHGNWISNASTNRA